MVRGVATTASASASWTSLQRGHGGPWRCDTPYWDPNSFADARSYPLNGATVVRGVATREALLRPRVWRCFGSRAIHAGHILRPTTRRVIVPYSWLSATMQPSNGGYGGLWRSDKAKRLAPFTGTAGP